MGPKLTVAIVVGWLLIGLFSGLWMARRGYDPLWVLLAIPLGLLFLPIAIERVRRRPALADVGAAGPPPDRVSGSTGPRVLVGNLVENSSVAVLVIGPTANGGR